MLPYAVSRREPTSGLRETEKVLFEFGETPLQMSASLCYVYITLELKGSSREEVLEEGNEHLDRAVLRGMQVSGNVVSMMIEQVCAYFLSLVRDAPTNAPSLPHHL